MPLSLAQIFKSSTAQSFRALTSYMEKAKADAAAKELPDGVYLDNRLAPDMHPMKWQIQMITEFAVRGSARLAGTAEDDLPDWPYDDESFDALRARIAKSADTVDGTDDAIYNNAAGKSFELPIGPDQKMEMDGVTYVTNFFLPNLHFHVAMVHASLRSQGLDVGKRDYMGM